MKPFEYGQLKALEACGVKIATEKKAFNPMLGGALVGAGLGAGAGALSAGQGNRMRGALAGGALGAGAGAGGSALISHGMGQPGSLAGRGLSALAGQGGSVEQGVGRAGGALLGGVAGAGAIGGRMAHQDQSPYAQLKRRLSGLF